MKPSLTTYRYGSSREANEGLRVGVARHVPRGVRREDWQRKGYFDLWVPLLAPDADLVHQYRHGEITFAVFSRHYRAEMKKRESLQVIELLAGISLFLPISIGCFCEDEAHCHRSILKEILTKSASAKSAGFSALQLSSDMLEVSRYASPVCFASDAHG